MSDEERFLPSALEGFSKDEEAENLNQQTNQTVSSIEEDASPVKLSQEEIIGAGEKSQGFDEDEEEEGEGNQVKECGCPCRRHWSSLEEEVARDEIWEWAEVEPCCCIPCLRVPDHWYGRHSIHVLYLFSTLTLLLFLMISVTTWVLVCPHCLNTYRFKSTNCVIQNITVNETRICGCHAQRSVCLTETCATVTVKYATKDGKAINSILYETAEDTMSKTVDECSLKPKCEGDIISASYVLEALEEWAFTGNMVPCSYDPSSPTIVILSSDYNKKITALFLAVTSGLCALSGAMVLGITLTICGCRYIWPKNAPENIKIKAALRKQQERQKSVTLKTDTVSVNTETNTQQI